MLSTVFFAYMQVHLYSKIYLLKYFNIHVYVNYLLMSKSLPYVQGFSLWFDMIILTKLAIFC